MLSLKKIPTYIITLCLLIYILNILLYNKKYPANSNQVGGNNEEWFIKKKFILPEELKEFSVNNLINILGNSKVKIAVFNNNIKVTNNDIGSYSTTILYGKLNKILYNNNNNNFSYQYKTVLENIHKNEVNKWFYKKIEKIILKIKTNYNKKSKESLIKLRINTVPWVFKTHFDCENNYAILLSGVKKILLFKYNKISIDNLKEINTFLLTLYNLKIDDIVIVLKKYNINYEIYTLYPGDLIYIPQYVFHYVEDVKSRDNVSILVNYLIYNKNNNKCSNIFRSIWKKQSNNCKYNNCLN